MLRVTAICVLLCLTGTVWSEEGGTTFDEAGATGRGPRVVDHGAQSQCKQEKSWGICADEDWGSKCPSGCRMQGLADQKDKEFGKRMDAVRKALVDNQNTYKSADLTTKETYNLIKENLVAGQSGEGLYNQVSEDLRRRISVLKIKVVNQLNTIKSLENSIRQQVQSMKRLEVDIDIKIRACKGSCSKGVVYNVDTSSYENMQKQLLQSSTIHLQPDTNEVPMLKMRLLKDDKPTHFKALTWDKFGDGQYNMFSDIEQRQMVIEKRQEVVECPSGCRLQGQISKMKREISSRLERAEKSWMASNTSYKHVLSLTKATYQTIGDNLISYQDIHKRYINVAAELQKRLTLLRQSVEGQLIKIGDLHMLLEQQIAVMLQIEVDIGIKIRSCRGSCKKNLVYNISKDNYSVWKKNLSGVKTRSNHFPSDHDGHDNSKECHIY